IATSSEVRIVSSETETVTMIATSASWAEKAGSVWVTGCILNWFAGKLLTMAGRFNRRRTLRHTGCRSFGICCHALSARSRDELQSLAFRGSAPRAEAVREGAARKGPCAVRDRLWPVGAAAYRHVRRGAAHDDDPPRIRDHQRHPDQAHLLFRRPRRDAQGSRQRAAAGDAEGQPATAADICPRSVRAVREL